jgi:hypothetical protein
LAGSGEPTKATGFAREARFAREQRIFANVDDMAAMVAMICST